MKIGDGEEERNKDFTVRKRPKKGFKKWRR